MRVGMVIIGRNEGERLERCLRAEAVGGCAGAVVYVDSGSTDGSVGRAREAGAEVVELDMTRPFTAARARNAGLARLLGMQPGIEFVQFVDGDCELATGWIEAGARRLAEEPKLAAVCGTLRERFPEKSVYNRLCQLEWNLAYGAVGFVGGIALWRVAGLREVMGRAAAEEGMNHKDTEGTEDARREELGERQGDGKTQRDGVAIEKPPALPGGGARFGLLSRMTPRQSRGLFTEGAGSTGPFDESLIAGEEPELCTRLRALGWGFERLREDMGWHDAAMTRFRQWWKRSVRAGYAFDTVARRHADSGFWRRDVRSNWAWGLGVPAVAVGLAPATFGLSLLLLALYGRLWWKTARHFRRAGMAPADARLYAGACVAGKLPQMVGQVRAVRDRWRGVGGRLIEYKGGGS